jgi:hypothetical protein
VCQVHTACFPCGIRPGEGLGQGMDSEHVVHA